MPFSWLESWTWFFRESKSICEGICTSLWKAELHTYLCFFVCVLSVGHKCIMGKAKDVCAFCHADRNSCSLPSVVLYSGPVHKQISVGLLRHQYPFFWGAVFVCVALEQNVKRKIIRSYTILCPFAGIHKYTEYGRSNGDSICNFL